MRGAWYCWGRVSSIAVLVVFLLALPSCGSGMEETFPMWRESGKEGALGRGSFALDKLNPDFEVRFEGVWFGAGASRTGRPAWTRCLFLRNTTGTKPSGWTAQDDG